MSFELRIRGVGDVDILDISGRVTIGEGAAALSNALRQMAAGGQKKVLLNLGNLSYVDSSGIGALVSSFASVRNAGGVLKLLNVGNRVKDVLLLTKLYTVFEVFDDEVTAVTSFAEPAIAVPAT